MLQGVLWAWLFTQAGAASQETWYLVDAPSVVCTDTTPRAAGSVKIQVPLDTVRAANQHHSPHIFTFYRTTTKSTRVSFEVTDARGQSVVANTTVDLRELSRRLTEVAEEGPPRQLRPRSGGFRSGGGHRSSLSGSPRRRSPLTTSSRRRVAAPAAQSLPGTGAGAGKFGNAHGQSSHGLGHGQSYGFARPQTMNQYYPGGYSQTGYGFSGMNSYRPNSGSNVMMAALGGAALGVGASYLYSRWNSYDRCQYGTEWTGSCRTCFASHPAESCSLRPPDVPAHRDDLMSSGFWPDRLTSPLTVVISAIEGQDFSKGLLCSAPALANSTSQLLARPLQRGADLFLTLTKVEELGPRSEDIRSGGPGSGEPPFTLLLLMLSCCFCVVSCATPALLKKLAAARKKQDHMSDEGETGGYGHGQRPVVMGAMELQGFPQELAPPDPPGLAFMRSLAPNGLSWMEYCDAEPLQVNSSGMLIGAWGECMAWAKAFEVENPNWANDPQYAADGPCGQVEAAVMHVGATGPLGEQGARRAAERLESACELAATAGKPLPLINYLVAAE